MHVGVQTTRRVGLYQRLAAQAFKHAQRLGHAIDRTGLVAMLAPAHDRHRPLTHVTQPQRAAVTCHSGLQKSGQLGVADLDGVGDVVGQTAPTRAQHHGDARLQFGGALADGAAGIGGVGHEQFTWRLSLMWPGPKLSGSNWLRV